MNTWQFRCVDFLLALIGLILASPLLLIAVVVGFFDTGSPLFIQQRVGLNQRPFILIKFRTMRVGTASVATHEASHHAITRWGTWLRKSKIDELPQLINVLKGEMSLVGPRPCLPSQQQLIDERQLRGVFSVLPGITGLAQVNAIDMSTPVLLAETDQQMIASFCGQAYCRYLLLTVIGRGAGDRVLPG